MVGVDVTSVAEILYQGADYLSSLHIRQDAPPADYMKSHGIDSIYVRTNEIQNDLAHILMRYQKKGMRIYQVSDNSVPKRLTVVRPSHYKSFLYRFRTLLGLTRNAAGDFGRMVPEATQSSRSRHYGIG